MDIIFLSSVFAIVGLIISMQAIDLDVFKGEDPYPTIMLAIGIAFIIVGVLIGFMR